MAKSPVAVLLQDRLARQFAADGLGWVERDELDKVLTELTRSAVFGSGGGADRVKLGAILKAHLLVVLRQRPTDKAVELVVCETALGLRLAVTSFPAQDGKPPAPEALAAALEPVIVAALKKGLAPINDLAAVPPFVSNDLSFKYEPLKGVYSTLVEQTLLAQDGIVVVELEEAQAIARELAIGGGNKIRRLLPLFIAGEFRHTDPAAVSFKITLRRGEKQLDQADLPPTAEAQVAPVLRKSVTAMLTKVLGTVAAEPDPKVESARLLERSRVFAKLNNWREAYGLVEAALLLDDNLDLRHDAVIAAGQMAGITAYGSTVSHDSITPDMINRGLLYYLRGIEHLEVMLQTLKNFDAYRRPGGNTFVEYFRMSWGITGHPSKEVLDALESAKAQSGEALMRIARMRLKDRRGDEADYVMWATDGLSRGKRYDFFLKVIEEWKNEPGNDARIRRLATHGYVPSVLDEPEGRDFLAKLAAIDHPDMNRLADSLKQQSDAYIAANAKERDAAKQELENRKAKEAADLAAGPAEVIYNPLTLMVNRGATGKPSPMEIFNGGRCMPAGPGIDVFWAGSSAYVMKTKGELRPIFNPQEMTANVARLVFDGKYVWIPVTRHHKPAQLIVVDPVTEKSYELTSADGLPLDAGGPDATNEQQYVRVAAISPGHVIVAGYFGRTWLADVVLNPTGRHKIKVFHEAREVANDADKDQWQQTNVAFQPAWMFTLTDPADKGMPPRQRVIIGRNASINVNYHPLLVDLAELKVSVVQDESCWTESYAFESHYGLNVFGAADAIWWAWPTRGMSGDVPRQSVHRMGFPDFKEEIIAPAAHSGRGMDYRDRYFVYHGRSFIAAKELWVADTPAGPYRKLRGDDPERSDFFERIGTGETEKQVRDEQTEQIEAVCFSNHYGLIIMGQRIKAGGTVYEVKFPGLPAPKTK